MNKENRIKKIISDLMEENDLKHFDLNNLKHSTSLTNDLGLDSFKLAQLTVQIESEFGIDVFEKSIVRTFGEIVEVLK